MSKLGLFCYGRSCICWKLIKVGLFFCVKIVMLCGCVRVMQLLRNRRCLEGFRECNSRHVIFAIT